MRYLAAHCCIAFTLHAYSQAGALDGNFDGDGIVTTTMGTSFSSGYSIAIQPDGKILLGGFALTGTDRDFALARYRPDGSLDPTFGTGGKVTIGGVDDDEVRAVVLQPDGKILMGGVGGFFSGGDNFYIVRCDLNGLPDAGFGLNGQMTTTVGSGSSTAHAIALQPDGRILLAGSATGGEDDDFALVRYNTNGTLDMGFSFDGMVLSPIGTGTDICRSIALQPDGKILLSGYSETAESLDIAVVRYLPDGTLDDSFGSGGKVTIDLGTNANDDAYAMALQPDGRIVICGSSGADIALARFLPNGTLDASFGSNGIVTTIVGTFLDTGRALALQSNGKIVVAGDSYQQSTESIQFAVLRYLPNGTLDAGFSTDGVVTTPFGNPDYGRSIAIQPDGKILVGGSAADATDSFTVLRYLNDLDIGILEFERSTTLEQVYPNPIGQTATLTFELASNVVLSCDVMDAQGRVVLTLFSKAHRAAGVHCENVDLSGLAAGSYSLVLSNGKGRTSVKVVKE